MNLQHVNAKIFVDGALAIGLDRLIEVFHGWVAQQSLSETLIDVADYRHVPGGPGVLLVGLEADYSLDHRQGRCGLRYNRKAPWDGSNDDRLLQAIRSAADVCLRLEAEFDLLRFSRREFELLINDRALAPNTEATYEYFRSALPAFLRERLGAAQFEIDFDRNPRHLFSTTIRLAQPLDLAAI
jgi:hypothetical protein